MQEITENYLDVILNWAIKKCGSRSEGEDLAQEVFLQIFLSLSKGGKIEKVENYIWKIAHFVWCRKVKEYHNENLILPISYEIADKADTLNDLIEKSQFQYRLDQIKREIANLSFLQRNYMVSYYIDGLSVRDISQKYGVSENTITWHLFDARKRIRKEINHMKQNKDFIYRPGRLSLGTSGDALEYPDTMKINDSLIKQNICLLCSQHPISLSAISESTGVPKPYLEQELDWLVEKEFLSKDGSKYSTIFPIIGERLDQQIGEIYQSTKSEYIDIIIDYFSDNEEKIRNIGFHGSDNDFRKLLWKLLFLFTSYIGRNTEICKGLLSQVERPIRPDGGKYIPIGVDKSANQPINPDGYIIPDNWKGYNGTYARSLTDKGYDNYYWLGLHTFKEQKPEIIHSHNKELQRQWFEIMCSVEGLNFNEKNLDSNMREILAQIIKEGYIERRGQRFYAKYSIFSKEQFSSLQEEIFKPLMLQLESKTNEIASEISAILHKQMPKESKNFIPFFTFFFLWETGIYAMRFTAEEGRLYLPEGDEKGSYLTLAIIK